jgi:DNA-binding PadR family transcriptional regulator
MEPRKKILKQLKMGTTEILILAILSKGDRYGYDISRDIRERSEGFFEFKQGFLYPTLRRMEEAGLITGYWKDSASGGPDRKYYRLTRQGRARLEASLEAWGEFRKRFDRFLAPAKNSWQAVLEQNLVNEGYSPAEAKDLVRLAAS